MKIFRLYPVFKWWQKVKILNDSQCDIIINLSSIFKLYLYKSPLEKGD